MDAGCFEPAASASASFLAHWIPPPHLLATPPPPHVLPLTQPPQSMRPPQPSATGPQSTCETQTLGEQPLHGPQSSVPEQPSLCGPHELPQVSGVQLPVPHWLAWPLAPHTWPTGQVPHDVTPPQPSLMVPQAAPALWQLTVEHEPPHTLGTPPPPQISPSGHVPQLSTPPQPSPIEPQSLPAAAQVVGVHTGPHRFGPPAPQAEPGAQVPQLMALPQPSPTLPQFAVPQPVGVQLVVPQVFGPPPPQN